jgi:hypothetical protein
MSPYKHENRSRDEKLTDDDYGPVNRIGVAITSNFVDIGNGTVQYIAAPFTKQAREIRKYDPSVDPLITREGMLKTINVRGEMLDEHPYPSVNLDQRALLTRTHWCFGDAISSQFFITAPIERPRELTIYRFPYEQLVISEANIHFNIRFLALLPGGRCILCSKKVMDADLDKAKEKGLALCELGVINLPFSIG